MKVLIIYEEIPESTKLYLVDVAPSEWAWMRLAHDQYINTVATDNDENAHAACMKLSTWLEDKKPLRLVAPLRDLSVDYVLVTGFVL